MQLGELHTLYEFDKIKAQKLRQRMIILFTGLGCFLLAVIVSIYVVYSHRLRSKNRSLYRQIQENKRNEDKAVRVLRLTAEEDLSPGDEAFFGVFPGSWRKSIRLPIRLAVGPCWSGC